MCAPPAVAALRESAGNLSDSAAKGISPALSRDAATGIGSPALACAKRHLGQKPPRASPVSGAPHLRQAGSFGIVVAVHFGSRHSLHRKTFSKGTTNSSFAAAEVKRL